MCDELRQSFAFVPGGSEPWVWIAKPNESCVQEFICGRSVSASTLSIEGPAKNKLCRTIMVSSHPSEPMVDERRLSDPSPGNDRNHIHLSVFPCIVQESD